ncbi:MAG: SDR family NAD(P)-dependent oxidoreductase, partial [Clostridium perfringens]|nr:SDR family NAD(P)-dependent oxidoreductase [Clostridium perfringens]
MNNLSGKVAYVTGSSKGIGQGIAIELGKLGASVIVGFNGDENGAKDTLNKIKENGGYGVVLKGDISKNEDIIKIKGFIEKNFGKLDILINNAGISNIGLFMDYSLDDIESLINTNLIGTMKITNALFNLIRKGKDSSIINISSIWGDVGASCEVLYSASKGGINAFTKALAKEIAPFGIRVNAVAPGVI